MALTQRHLNTSSEDEDSDVVCTYMVSKLEEQGKGAFTRFGQLGELRKYGGKHSLL